MEKYEKIRAIGQGAFGKVFLVRRKQDKFLLVIKEIPLDEMSTEERKSAQNEVDVLRMLRHPNIIGYYDSFVKDTALNIVMEYAPGGTLHEFLQQRNNKLLEEERVMQFFAQILVALEHVHSHNIMHRDLKTQNIMLCKKKKVVKIGDFGISKVLSSKITSAKSVVGTPCYISPEICEGKIYRKKSDIWALGCLLHEIVTLRKAFEADNLPALVNKIMHASVKPIDEQYSKGLCELQKNMLQLNPDLRPGIEDIMAEPLVINALINLYTDIGRLPCSNRTQKTVNGPYSNNRKTDEAKRRVGAFGKLHQGSFYDDLEDVSGGHGSVRPEVFMWGGGISIPLLMPLQSDDEVTQIATSRSQQLATTKEGKLIVWECASGSLATTQFQTMSEKKPLTSLSFVPRPLKSDSYIKQVSCGDHYTVCVTDKGILMTFGSGVNGCLGHGNYDDLKMPRLVEGLLDKEVVKLSAGSTHVMVITDDDCLFAWGKGDMGQLGLGNQESYSRINQVPFPSGYVPMSVCCGTNASIVITKAGRVLATGSNSYNKLALNGSVPVAIQPIDSGSSDTLQNQFQSSQNKTVIANPSVELLKPSSSKLFTSSMSSSILTASLKLARKLLEEEGTANKSGDKGSVIPLNKDTLTPVDKDTSDKDKPSPAHDKDTVAKEACDIAPSTKQSESMEPTNGGKLPTVDKVDHFRPVVTKLLSQEQVTTVSMGTSHTALVTALGKCVTTGCNVNGQLGYHRSHQETQPGVVEALGHNVTMVTCGDSYTAAVTKAGEVFAWGKSQRGRLGREEKSNYSPQPKLIPFECPYHMMQICSCSSITMVMGRRK